MKERISSSLTFIEKFIFTSIWSCGFGFGTLAMIISPEKNLNDTALIFGVTWVLGSAFLFWCCGRLKRIDISNNNIIVSNYFKIVAIPVKEIDSVTQNLLLNIRPITIRLKKETVFGRTIVFMPKYEFRLFSENTVVERLRNLAIRTE